MQRSCCQECIILKAVHTEYAAAARMLIDSQQQWKLCMSQYAFMVCIFQSRAVAGVDASFPSRLLLSRECEAGHASEPFFHNMCCCFLTNEFFNSCGCHV